MRYRVEILYSDGTFDIIHYNSYDRVSRLITFLKLAPNYKDIRVYKLIGQYKKDENIKI